MGSIEFYTYCPDEGVVKIYFAGIPPLGSTPEENRIVLPIACKRTRPPVDPSVGYKLRRIYSYKPHYELLIPIGGVAVNMLVYRWESIGFWWTWKEYKQRAFPFTIYQFPAWDAPWVYEDWQRIPNLLFLSTTTFMPPFADMSNPRDQDFQLHVYLVIYKASQDRFLYSEYLLQGPKWKKDWFGSIAEVMKYWEEVRETLLLFHDAAVNGEEIAIYPHPLGRIDDWWEGQYRVLKVMRYEWFKAIQVGQNSAPEEPQNYYMQFIVQDSSRDAMAVIVGG